jgi:hypothetical protein
LRFLATSLGAGRRLWIKKISLLIVPVCAIFAAKSIRFICRAMRKIRIKQVLFTILLLLAALLITRAQPFFEMRSETNLLLIRAQDEAGYTVLFCRLLITVYRLLFFWLR